LVLSEGSIDKNRWAINITQCHGKNHQELKKLFDSFGVNWNYDGKRYSFNNKALCKYLEQFGKSWEKFIPNEIKNLSKEDLLIIFKSLMAGDGQQISERKYIYTTASSRLRDDVMEISLKLGFVPTCSTWEPKKETHHTSYHISITKRNEDTRCEKLKHKDYSGKVYSVNVPPYHNILIRHKGRVMFCGQSAEFASIAIDEITQNDKVVFDFLRTRLRWPQISDVKFLAGTNPGGKGHVWVKKLWLDKEYEKTEREAHLFHFIKATAFDNKRNLSESYFDGLSGLPEKMRKAYLDGNWDIFEGQYFTEWDREQHVVTPFQIPQNWKKFRSYDHGRVKPACCLWFAVDYDGRVWCYRELYKAGWDVGQLADEIKKLSVGEKYHYSIADPSIFAKTGQETIGQMFERRGINFLGANKRRVDGWNLMHEYLAYDDNDTSRIKFFRNCKETIKTLPSLIHDKIRPEDVDSSGEDHAADATRYFLMSLRERKVEQPKTETERKLEAMRPKKKLDFNMYFPK